MLDSHIHSLENNLIILFNIHFLLGKWLSFLIVWEQITGLPINNKPLWKKMYSIFVRKNNSLSPSCQILPTPIEDYIVCQVTKTYRMKWLCYQVRNINANRRIHRTPTLRNAWFDIIKDIYVLGVLCKLFLATQQQSWQIYLSQS